MNDFEMRDDKRDRGDGGADNCAGAAADVILEDYARRHHMAALARANASMLHFVASSRGGAAIELACLEDRDSSWPAPPSGADRAVAAAWSETMREAQRSEPGRWEVIKWAACLAAIDSLVGHGLRPLRGACSRWLRLYDTCVADGWEPAASAEMCALMARHPDMPVVAPDGLRLGVDAPWA